MWLRVKCWQLNEVSLFSRTTMDFQTLTSNNCVDRIRCIQCKNFLSYFPICVTAENKNVCGRCVEGNNCNRNDVYEAIVQFLKFPCRFKKEGCHEEMLPKDMPQHESICFFRIIKCPTFNFTKCKWRGSHRYLLEHCSDQHFEVMLEEEEFEVDTSSNEARSRLLKQCNVLFIVTIKSRFKQNTVECSVSHFEIENYSCEIIIRSGNRKLSVELNTSRFDAVDFNTIILDSLKSISNKSPLFAKINVGKMRDRNVEQQKEETNLRMLTELKCSVCLEYAVPPIYQCSREVSVLCSDCNNNHVLTCKTCKENETESTNVTLNKVASFLDYPCKYKQDGCNFSSRSYHIKFHQKFCSYATIDCPVSNFGECNWWGLGKDVAIHLDTDHQDVIIGAGKLCFPVPRDKPQIFKRGLSTRSSRFFVNAIQNYGYSCRIIKFANRIFRLLFGKVNQHFRWKLEIIGEGAENFKYVIDVIDQCNNGRRLSAKQVCAPLCQNEEMFQDPTEYCYFDSIQISPFIFDNNIVFNIKIVIGESTLLKT